MAQGWLIAIDGIDGAGKTTLAHAMAAALPEAFDRVVTKEPTGGQWGQQLRESARSGRHDARKELELLTLDRHEHVDQVIAPALARGAVVILDRYVYSTAAYQSDSMDHARQILDDQFAFAPVPDLALIIDTPVTTALGRIHSRGDVANHFERLDTLTFCREVFVNTIAKRPEVKLLDGSRSAADVFNWAAGHLLNMLALDAQSRHGCTLEAAKALAPLFAQR